MSLTPAIPSGFDLLFTVILWGLFAIYLSMDIFWLIELFLAYPQRESHPIAYGPADTQIRILTIDAEAVVQRTVDAIPPACQDCHVISETPMAITGATVHVVPDTFECQATRKGRALEWARRHVPCEKEFVLFLDEDTVIDEFDGLPDADVVQLRELPQRTDSWLSLFAEMYRMGFQIEQQAFDRFAYPLYTWGGGLAIKKALEDEVTWNVNTLIEDTMFVWRACHTTQVTYTVVPTKFKNQAPPSLLEMVKQRRRWIAGSREEVSILPPRYRVLYAVRDLSWGLSPLIPAVFLIPFVVPELFLYQGVFRAASVALFGFIVVWVVIGIRYYGTPLPASLGVLALSPVIVIPHAAGALYGLVSKPATFDVTQKVPPPVEPTPTPRDQQPALPAGAADVSGGTSVLILDPHHTVGEGLCLQLLARSEPHQSNVILLTESMTPHEWLQRWEHTIGTFPQRLGIVSIGSSERGTGARPTGVVVDHLSDPSDLNYAAILLDTYVRRWPTNETSICIDGITRLIAESSVDAVLGWISVIQDIIEGTDTVVHFHLDPTQVDQRVVRRVARACDLVLEDPGAIQSPRVENAGEPVGERPRVERVDYA